MRLLTAYHYALHCFCRKVYKTRMNLNVHQYLQLLRTSFNFTMYTVFPIYLLLNLYTYKNRQLRLYIYTDIHSFQFIWYTDLMNNKLATLCLI